MRNFRALTTTLLVISLCSCGSAQTAAGPATPEATSSPSQPSGTPTAGQHPMTPAPTPSRTKAAKRTVATPEPVSQPTASSNPRPRSVPPRPEGCQEPAKHPSATAPSGMTITLGSDKQHYSPGEKVTLVMTVTNTTDQEQTFQHSTSGYIGFRVQNDEVEIWDSQYMAGALQARSSETYAPGQARQFKAVWNQGVC